MIELIEKLKELSERIGNGACVSLEFCHSESLPPQIIFRVDWRNGYHCMEKYSYMRLANHPKDLLEMLAEVAKQQYEKQNNG